MEAQTDIQTYLEQGKQALAQGQGREAAIAYAHGAQLEPENPMVHLGLAEANLALGNYGVVQMACRRVQELQPSGGIEAGTAQALLDVLDRRYERALQQIDAVISQDPGIAYAHALRAFLLRATGQDYDANLARARSARLSYGGRFVGCFPDVEPGYSAAYNGTPTARAATPDQTASTESTSRSQVQQQEPVPTWSRPNGMQRHLIRTRFALSRYPGLVTYTLIVINALVYLWMTINPAVLEFGAQDNFLVMHGQPWRIFTAMFLHDPTNLLHLGLNMLSLFFIGRVVEIIYGQWRYLLIYLISGIVGGIFFLFLTQPCLAVGAPGCDAIGASGAIFGVFGALGAFYFINRRALGAAGRGAIMNWLFWLFLNIAFGLAPGSNIAIWAHAGGLVAGMILAFLLIPKARRGRMMF